MKLLPDGDTTAAIARHPIILAGAAVVLLLGLVAGALVIVDSVRGDDTKLEVEIEPRTTATAGPVSKTAVALGVSAVTNTTTAVRFGPGTRSQVLGTLPRGTDVQIDGRTTDANWFRIIFPPGSELHGWVDHDSLDITGDAESLAVTTAEPPIVVDLPTQPPTTITPVGEETPAETGTPDGTSTPGGLPDLVVGSTPTISGGKLFVTVVNQGTGDFTGDLVVAVFNADQTALLGGATVPSFTLEAGQSIDVGTGMDVTESITLLLVVDPNGEVEESDNANNNITISIAVGDEPDPDDQPLPFETPLGID